MEKINIENIISNYKDTKLDCNPVYAPSNGDIIGLIDCYFANKYRDNEYDSTGMKKSFFNIVINPTEIASKMIDLDTKDVKIVAEDGQSYYPAWLFGKELKIWMKDKKNENGQTFGQLLNQMVYSFPKYGHLIAKKVKDTVHIVPIQNMACDNPTGKSFTSSDVIIETHEMTEGQLGKQKNWENVDNAISKYTNEDGVVVVYEIHDITKDKNNYVIIPKGAKDGEELYIGTKKREDLYKEVKWEDMPGRVLGRGQPEKLFEAQIAKNQNEHYLRSGYRWTSKKLWQTRDDNIAKNLITELEDGDVLTVNSEITPISMEERNLSAINLGDAKWDNLISKLSFSSEPMSGERPPSGTPFGTTKLQAVMAGQFYDLKREELGMFIKDILFDWIIPEFKKQKNGKHILMLGEFDEDELLKLKELVFERKNNNALIKHIQKTGAIPDMREMEVLKAINRQKLKAEKDIKIPEGFYDNLKYKIDIIITNEQIDMASKMTTLQVVLQILGSNPAIMSNPRTRKIFMKLLDLSGISPTEFRDEEPQLDEVVGQNAPQRGGSTARVSQAPQMEQANNLRQI